MTVCILGAGAFGSALASNLATDREFISLWSRSGERVQELQKKTLSTKSLDKSCSPKNVVVTSNIKMAMKNAEVILICIPAQSIYTFFNNYHELIPNIPIVLCSKGIDDKTLLLQSQIVKSFLIKNEIAILTGPSFAKEISVGLPTALTLACENRHIGDKLQKLLSRPNFRLYSSTDIIGAQIGGALKNVLAIGCGMIKGRNLGESARIAFMTRGLSEMINLGTAMGGKVSTFYGLSGLGDLALTCNSIQSRNFNLGIYFSKDHTSEFKGTIEGIKTASAASKLAQNLSVDAPIITTINLILERKVSLDASIKELLSRPLKDEFI